MATRVTFDRVVQDAKEFGSTETRAVSRVFFTLMAGGATYPDLYVDLTEPVGSDHADENIAVGSPRSADAAVDPSLLEQGSFEQAVRAYYQRIVTSAGYGKHLAKGKGFRTFGDTLGLVQTVEL